MPVNDEVEIRFPYPCPTCDPGSPIIIWHIETTATLTIDTEGRVNNVSRPTPEALAATCGVLFDQAVMAEAQARAAEIIDFSHFPPDYMIPNPCERLDTPISLEPFTTMTLEGLGEYELQRRIDGTETRPPGYTRAVNEDLEVRYAYPTPKKVWPAPITIFHVPTSTTVNVDLEGQIVGIHRSDGPAEIAAVCSVLNDESLMAELISLVADIGAYWRYEPTVSPDPCAGVE